MFRSSSSDLPGCLDYAYWRLPLWLLHTGIFAPRWLSPPCVEALRFLVLIVVVLWQLPNIVSRIPIVTRFVPERLSASAVELYAALTSYRNHLPTLIAAVAISTVLQMMLASYYAMASVAMGIPIDLIYFLLFLPAVTLISLIPLSLGGLGIREASMAVLFAAAGIAAADVVAVSLTIHIINTLLSLWGGVLLLRLPPGIDVEFRNCRALINR